MSFSMPLNFVKCRLPLSFLFHFGLHLRKMSKRFTETLFFTFRKYTAHFAICKICFAWLCDRRPTFGQLHPATGRVTVSSTASNRREPSICKPSAGAASCCALCRGEESHSRVHRMHMVVLSSLEHEGLHSNLPLPVQAFFPLC